MRTNFQIQDYQGGKLIRLSSPFSSRTRILDFVYAINFLVAAIAFTYLFISEWHEVVMAAIIAVLGIVAFTIGFYRFINKATETEKIFINKKEFEIINSSLLKVDKKSFLIGNISDFRFLEKERYEPHPLKGETFDYLGFQTEQQVIQDLHSEGRASFIYNGRQVRFGKELASWEFNELEVLLYEASGNDLRYTDKYEQENYPDNSL
jgi:hypothetical protein